jgi:hypothetical protein
MPEYSCRECGFSFAKNDVLKCFKYENDVDSAYGAECSSFFERQYDGSEPFSPEDHAWLFEEERQRKSFKPGIRGLRI